MSCINKNLLEYQTLKHRSGLSENDLDIYCRGYLNRFDRFPYLDELPDSNSREFLNSQLQIKEGIAKSDKVMALAGTRDQSLVNARINNIHRDVQVRATFIKDSAIIDIEENLLYLIRNRRRLMKQIRK